MPFSLRKVTPSASKTETTHTNTLDIHPHVGSAFMSVVTAESLRGKWLTASCLREIIKQRYAFRDASDFTPAMLTRAINKVNLSIDTHDATNTTGQFRLKKTLVVDGKSTRVIFYYITEEGKPYVGNIPSSNETAAWKKFYDRSQAAGEERLTRSRARAKKARAWDEIDSALQEYHSLEDFQKRLNGKKSVYDFPTYWQSTEAKKLFCPKPDETVEDALDRKIESLDNVMNEPGGYKLILPGDGDPDDHYTDCLLYPFDAADD